ncbi:hypothetical protein JoomaDRAFT_1149 [Galbibacter orientalis DSM 19592]|uniref:Uncharacterized protein n=1 Tax=Galbibacter orientalis DSM 19592 TaxID=926559 RepID=I3C3H5_9FLAO|nr:hypothetical protein JoomaDRAFT_1149 [Galbibacter orientalis DSM 19592]
MLILGLAMLYFLNLKVMGYISRREKSTNYDFTN